MRLLTSICGVLSLAARVSAATSKQSFTLVNGQILTPGLAIIDSPQPNTPLGGDVLEITIEVSGNGRLPSTAWQQYATPNGIPAGLSRPPSTGFEAVNIFLWSRTTGLNLTVVNGTTDGWTGIGKGGCNSSTSLRGMCTPLLQSESGSTVKHVRWTWPDCFAGDGGDSGSRGEYNISVHQSFRANATNYYTIFDLPIEITNTIPKTTASGQRIPCSELNNSFVKQNSDSLDFQPWMGAGAYLEGTNSIGSELGTPSTTAGGPPPSSGAGAVFSVGMYGLLLPLLGIL